MFLGPIAFFSRQEPMYVTTVSYRTYDIRDVTPLLIVRVFLQSLFTALTPCYEIRTQPREIRSEAQGGPL
jgi:hypothetical protein